MINSEARLGAGAAPLAPASGKTFAGLELCRFLCAVAVVLWHYQHFFLPGMWADAMISADRSAFPLFGLLRLFYQNGDKAVAVFWVISGFIFFWKYADGIHGGTWRAGHFFVWRLSRLYPLHLATLLIVAVLQYLYIASHAGPFIYGFNDAPHFMLQLVLASNWLGSEPFTFNGPIWSISAEIVAYTAFFVFAWAVRPSWLKSLAVIILASLVLRWRSEQPAMSCILFFFAGGLLQQGLAPLGPRGLRAAFWVMLAGLLAMAAMAHFGLIIQQERLVVLAVCIVGVCITADTATGLDFSRIVPLGNLTYASYLVHFPIQLALVLIVDGLGYQRSLFLSPVALVGFLALTFGLAALIHRRYEMPVQDAIRALWRARRPQLVRP